MDYGVTQQYVELHTLADTVPSKLGVGVFANSTYGEYTVPDRDTRNTPYYIYSPGEIKVSTEPYYGSIHKADVEYVSILPTKPSDAYIREVSNGGESHGFLEISGENSYTSREDYMISIPPVIDINSSRVDAASGEVSVTAELSPSVSVLTGKYNSPRNRAVCSDILLRRSLPCYIGVYLRYVGGSASSILKVDIKNLVMSSLRRGVDISGSDVVSLAHRRGARHVSESAVYIVMTDALRRRRIFFLRGPMSESFQGSFSGSLRIIGTQLSESEKLGVTLDVERL